MPQKVPQTAKQPPQPLPTWKRLLLIVLIPLVMPGLIIGLAAFLIIVGCAIVWNYPHQLWRDWRFRRFLRSRGRLIELVDLEQRLQAGEGTLIEEWGPKGVQKVWWTSDDIASQEPPLEFDERIRALFSDGEKPGYAAAREFNQHCLSEYVSKASGKASMVSISARYAKSGRLIRAFPGTRQVTVVPPPRWWHENRVA